MYSDFEMDTSDLHMSESIGKGEIIPKTSWQSPEIIFEFDGIIFSKKDLLLAGKNQTLIKFVPQRWNNGLLETSGAISEVENVPMEKIDILITDSEAEPIFIEGLEEMGVQVIIEKQFKKEVR